LFIALVVAEFVELFVAFDFVSFEMSVLGVEAQATTNSEAKTMEILFMAFILMESGASIIRESAL
jgi:hypothetical protein